ncbi:MAG: amino acid permease [Vulcanimicrobiaceae bacterium]
MNAPHAPLRRALGIFETTGVSIAIMAPTAAMALNGALAAAYAGPAVPLAFVFAFATIGCVAFAFVTFARVYASAASVGEFNARGLGPLAGRLSAWALLLVYGLFTAGSAAECGAFAAAAFGYAGRSVAWLPVALGALALAGYVGTRPARTSSRAMLAVEGFSVAAIVLLALAIVARGGATGNAWTPFVPHGDALGGLGLATVFALLSFAGFEGAAVLGEESLEPKRTIPRALIASVVVAGGLYVFVAYAQTIGFGGDARGVARYAAAAAPLGDLALQYGGARVAIGITAGAAISAFAAALASATGAARLLYRFAADARLPAGLARVDPRSGTPSHAFAGVLVASALGTGAFAVAGVTGTAAFAACGTVAVLALVPVYAAVQVAALRLFATTWSPLARAIPVVATVLLVATFFANVVPVPSGAAAWYPAVVAVWIAAGTFVLRDRARDAILAERPIGFE